MPDVTVFIFGDSHIAAMEAAYRKRVKQGRALPFECVIHRLAKFKPEAGAMLGNLEEDRAATLLSEARPTDVLISMLGGNQANAFGMMQHPLAFDVFDPDMPAETSDESVVLIPSRVLDDAFDGFMAGKHAVRLKAMIHAFPGRTMIAVPPPPKADDEFVRTNAETYFRQLGIEAVGVSPARLRLKLWRAQVRALDRQCRRSGYGLLLAPPGAVDETGFLRREAYGPDATHANAYYGGLLLDHIVDTRVWGTSQHHEQASL